MNILSEKNTLLIGEGVVVKVGVVEEVKVIIGVGVVSFSRRIIHFSQRIMHF